jgi:hypothetical protein
MLARPAFSLQILCDVGHADLSNDLWHRNSRLDLVVPASHVLRQPWRREPICVIGGGDTLLLDDDVVPCRAILQGFQDVGSDAGRLGDRRARGCNVQAADVSFET